MYYVAYLWDIKSSGCQIGYNKHCLFGVSKIGDCLISLLHVHFSIDPQTLHLLRYECTQDVYMVSGRGKYNDLLIWYLGQ